VAEVNQERSEYTGSNGEQIGLERQSRKTEKSGRRDMRCAGFDLGSTSLRPLAPLAALFLAAPLTSDSSAQT
jgi:hypothetical protein